MQRWVVCLCVGIVILSLIGIVGGGFLWADARLQQWAETTAERRIQRRLPQADRVDVSLGSDSVLLGLLLDHEVPGVHVHIDRVHHFGWELSDLRLDAEGIAFDRDALLDEYRLVITGIDSASMAYSIPVDELAEVVGRPITVADDRLWTTEGATRLTLRPVIKAGWLVLERSGKEDGPHLYYPLPMEGSMPCAPRIDLEADRLTVSCGLDSPHLDLPELALG